MSLNNEQISSNFEKITRSAHLSYVIEEFERIEETIRILFLKAKGHQLRKNGLPSLLSGMGHGSVNKAVIDAFKDKTGVDKETCTVAMLAINKLLLQLSNGKTEFQVPDSAIVAI